MPMTNQLLDVFARSIFAKKTLFGPELNDRERRRLRKSIVEDIRTCGAFIFPKPKKPEVSEAAQRKASQKGINLCEKCWEDQPSFDPKRKEFQWEHVVPIVSILKACEPAKSPQDILRLLQERLRIAWILKRENDELNRRGFKSKRKDPEAAYREAGIRLLKF